VLRLVWLLPALPLAGAAVNLLAGRRLGRLAGWLASALVAAAFAIGVAVLLDLVAFGAQDRVRVVRLFDWISVGSFHVTASLRVDPLSMTMALVVTGVGALIHLYAIGYMAGDPRFGRFFGELNLFVFFMLMLVLADSYLLLYVGWEGVGLCSYLLIGFWSDRPAAASAAKKAFITTRIGDAAMLLGIVLIWVNFHTLEFGRVFSAHGLTNATATTISLLLLAGAVGKSAQFPLHVWLPDAMEGPTPVSALIHAATMVAAGVYMVARLFEVFVQADPFVLTIVSVIGAITLLLAALLALVQDDIKRVLAYSTISQLAYMVAALGLGELGYSAGIFHLFTHAFFKALLFLGAGSVIHAVHSNNMSEMGGLRSNMKVTFVTFLIGSAALAGIPPFAGFFSKDEIILAAKESGHLWLSVVLIVGAVLTAFYTTRMVLKTFFGEYRGHAHPHESPRVMTGPLVFLAAATCTVGLLGFAPTGAPFLDWVFFGPAPHEAIFDSTVAVLSIAAVIVGLVLGFLVYRRYAERDPITKLGPAYTLLEHKYYLDDVYWYGIIRPVRDNVSAAVYWVNQNVLDGVVNGAAATARGFSRLTMWFDRNVIDGAVNGLANLTGESGGLLKYLQSGNVQWYAVGLFAGAFLLTAVFVIR
jgi:NADH-quinone oxidoreductase subunit L